MAVEGGHFDTWNEDQVELAGHFGCFRQAAQRVVVGQSYGVVAGAFTGGEHGRDGVLAIAVDGVEVGFELERQQSAGRVRVGAVHVCAPS